MRSCWSFEQIREELLSRGAWWSLWKITWWLTLDPGWKCTYNSWNRTLLSPQAVPLPEWLNPVHNYKIVKKKKKNPLPLSDTDFFSNSHNWRTGVHGGKKGRKLWFFFFPSWKRASPVWVRSFRYLKRLKQLQRRCSVLSGSVYFNISKSFFF